MLPLVYDILTLAAVTIIGAGVGYCLRGCRPIASAMKCFAAGDGPPAKAPEPAFDVQSSLVRVRELTQRVAADVGSHGSQLRQLSAALSGSHCDVAELVAQLVGTNDLMQQQLSLAELRLLEQARMIEVHVSQSRTDALTGLGSRMALDDQIGQRLEQYQVTGEPTSVLLLDIDHFDDLSDLFSHIASDEVLRQVSAILRQYLRPNDLLARIAGQTFAVVFPGLTGEHSSALAETVRAAIGTAEFVFEQKQFRLTASAGLSELLPGDSPASALRRSDEALHHAKKAGRDRGFWKDGARMRALVAIETPADQVLSGAPPQGPAEVAGPRPRSPQSAPSAPLDDALRDPLTQLSNRTGFNQDLARRLAEHRRFGTPVCVTVIKIDGFREILEQQGSDACNTLIQLTARFLTASSRADDQVACYEQDTFAVLMSGAQLEIASRIAERLRTVIAKFSLTLADKPFQFTASLGVAEESGDDSSPAVIDRAMAAVSIAAKHGGNQVVVSRGGRMERMPAQADLAKPEAKLQHAHA